ncbi:hypothetical protein V2W45_1232866, partial [Cenococcum geophilum]
FRTVSNSSRLTPFILAFAKALKTHAVSAHLHANKWSRRRPDGQIQFEMRYYAPDRAAHYRDEKVNDQKFRRLYFEFGSCVPDQLREVGRSRWRKELVERFLVGKY